MNYFERLKSIINSVLGVNMDSANIRESSPLLGHIPEFDSLAVVSVIEAIEDQFDIVINDDEVDAEIFETFGSLLGFIERKVSDFD